MNATKGGLRQISPRSGKEGKAGRSWEPVPCRGKTRDELGPKSAKLPGLVAIGNESGPEVEQEAAPDDLTKLEPGREEKADRRWEPMPCGRKTRGELGPKSTGLPGWETTGDETGPEVEPSET